MEALDGLRAASIVVVLFAHGSQTANAPHALQPMAQLGVFGVEVFFTISGFIITLLLIRERRSTAHIDLAAFWKRRAWRILPPFFAACAGLYLVAACGLFQWSWSSFIGAATFTKNTPLFDGGWFFGHFWSLSMEEQFYLFWPLVFVWTRTLHRAAIVLGITLAAGPLIAAFAPPAIEWSLPFVPVLAAGCLFAVLIELRPGWLLRYAQRRHLRLVLLCLVLAATVPVAYWRHRALWPGLTIPLNAALVPCACMLVLMESTFASGWLRRVLSKPAMVWLGRISYSLYLWQQLFMGAPSAYLKHWVWAQWPLNIGMAVICGALGYLLIEKPAQRLSAASRRKVGSVNRSTSEPARMAL